jgi:hypothetical protein
MPDIALSSAFGKTGSKIRKLESKAAVIFMSRIRKFLCPPPDIFTKLYIH